MIPRNEILLSPLQPQENGSPYERSFFEPEIKLFEKVYYEGYLKPLFERIYYECSIKSLKETIIVESGKIYISQTDEDKLKSIFEIWDFYFNYAKTQSTNNKKWRNIKVENTYPPLIVDIYPKKIKEVFSHTAKDEKFRSKIICIQALPILIQKMSNITLTKDTKNRNKNEYWFNGICKNVIIDKIPYNIIIKLVKKENVSNPQFYIYFVNDIELKKID